MTIPQRQDDQADRLIDLHAHQQPERIPGMVAQLSADDPVRVAAEAMVAFARFMAGNLEWGEVQKRLDIALHQPSASPDLQVCILDLLRHPFLKRLECHPEREAILERMRRCGPGLRHPFAKAALQWAEYFSATHRMDLAAARRAAEVGMAASLEATDSPRFVLRLIEIRLAQRDLAGLDQLITKLRNDRPSLSREHERFHLEHRLLTGHAAELVRFADQTPDPERPWLSSLVLEACLRCGEHRHADAIAERMAAGDPSLVVQRKVELHRIRALYWQRAYGAAAEAVRTSAARHRDHPGWQRLMCMHSVAIDLAQRATAQAQATLLAIDPRADQGDCRTAWIRLYLQQGDLPSAAALFAQIVGQGVPGLVAHELAEAHEIDAVMMYDLTRMVMSAPQIPPPAPPAPRSSGDVQTPDGELVGSSGVMAAVRSQVRVFARFDQPVLILGETGTGKEIVARQLHAHGNHPKEPFVALNCAALGDSLAESELFGHRKGAFTGAVQDHPGLIGLAGHGTLLLD
ncbi:MAG: hypothetical protein RLZZ127_2795, partial [Planctomycetota bacterium]